MTVVALFILDDRIKNLQEQASQSQQDVQLTLGEEVGGEATRQQESGTEVSVCYWLAQSLKYGLVDSLAKLNPSLGDEPWVHSHYLRSIVSKVQPVSFPDIKPLSVYFSMNFTLCNQDIEKDAGNIINEIYVSFGYYLLVLSDTKDKDDMNVVRAQGDIKANKQLSFGIRVETDQAYLFDPNFGLLRTDFPHELQALLANWLQDKTPEATDTHYYLWRVTL